MDSKLLFIIAAVLLDGLAGLTGGLLPTAYVQRHIASLLAFAAGTLIATAFMHLLPEALSGAAGQPGNIMAAALGGFFAFYVMETFIGSHAAGPAGHKHHHGAVGPAILVGDALHNTTDGLAIAAAFTADFKTGLATTIAVFVHELPQEVGDYSILLAHGYSRGRALFWLFLVQLSAFVGAFGALWAASVTVAAAPYLMAVSAGGFLYIAAADLLPELQRHHSENSHLPRVLAFSGGLGAIALLEYCIK